MQFIIDNQQKSSSASVLYRADESSFDYTPYTNVDINILAAYIQIGIDSQDMCVKALWGYSPQSSWEVKHLRPPCAETGVLQLKACSEREAGITRRIDTNNMWKSYYDREIGWFCLGEPTWNRSDKAVKLFQNVIFTVSKSNDIKGIWIYLKNV